MARRLPMVTFEEHQEAMDDLRNELDELRARQDEDNSWLTSVMTKRIIVHTKQDQSIDGSLVARMDDGIILRAARLLNSGANPTSMAGEVFIPRENVAFAQLDE